MSALPSPAHVARCVSLAASVTLATAAIPSTVTAQQAAACRSLCSPKVAINTALLRSHVFGGPRVARLSDGTESTLPGRSSLELQILTVIQTMIPRTSLSASVQWLPNASSKANPFTEYTASDEGSSIHANTPSVSLDAAVSVITPEDVGGWFGVSVYGGDLFSPAARPEDRSDYTHKLDLGATASVLPFAELSKGVWLHSVSVYATLDYVASGLPGRGDVVPKGSRRFLTNAKPAALIAGLSIPIAPLGLSGGS